MRPINMFRVHASLPTRRTDSVTHPFVVRSSNPKALTASSTVSSAMARYVVHLPPAMVKSPLGDT
jgi:hypothetical protein